MPKRGRKSGSRAGNDAENKIIMMDEGWRIVKEIGIVPFFARVEIMDSGRFSKKSLPRDQYLQTYDTIFSMCIQREPFNFSERLYEKHSKALLEYFDTSFKPRLNEAKEKHGVAFLKEWVKRWRSCI